MNYTENNRRRIADAYLQMARIAHYRPAAPSDGFGNIQLTKKTLADEARLVEEAHNYAEDFIKHDGAQSFRAGVSSSQLDKALVYSIEAARNLCGGKRETQIASTLLKMAAEEVGQALERE